MKTKESMNSLVAFIQEQIKNGETDHWQICQLTAHRWRLRGLAETEFDKMAAGQGQVADDSVASIFKQMKYQAPIKVVNVMLRRS